MIVMTADELRALIREELRSPPPANDEWMTTEEVARLLGVKRSTVPAIVTRDGLPCYRPGKGYTFRRDEVLAWLRERSNRPGAKRRKGKLVALKGG